MITHLKAALFTEALNFYIFCSSWLIRCFFLNGKMTVALIAENSGPAAACFRGRVSV